MTEFIVIFVTTSSEQEAERIADDLVQSRLVACANIVRGIRSIFRWKGAVQKEEESLLILKSRSERFRLIEERISALHSYETPEVISLPVLDGSSPYLQWIRAETEN